MSYTHFSANHCFINHSFDKS